MEDQIPAFLCIMKQIDKSYNPEAIEEKWYNFWLENGYFHAEMPSNKPPFCIVIPPPNVTGSLHMGHALNSTLQDILIRWKRMMGYNALWLPGTDHAGIATQNVVERQLAKEGIDRHKLGRTAFIQRVWEWKEQYGGRIIHQLKRLGSSCDWQRERFTLDEGLSRAVREVFVRLYEDGLIYRGDYIINWCPRCQTALSDLEVEREDIEGRLYFISYPFTDSEGSVVVATTRPETMLGDTAVAVNPKDKRYMGLIGKTLRLPILSREIPLISDDAVDIEFGTGAVKVTPAHDANDFEIASRHNLPSIKIMTEEGRMSEDAGPYKGQDRFECRKNILKDLDGLGLLLKEERYTIGLGHCYRCKTIVEPYLSKQWFVRTWPLAEKAIEAVREKRIRIIPEMWENSYFDWMHRIKDWCISRQIWWGHRIPAWYCQDCGEVNVSRDEPKRCRGCGSSCLKQEDDVLDTWFSSALWPFSTLGWPDNTEELKTFYPTDVLVTGFDILFFWVARMIMMAMKFMDDVPFRDVYIHALVRDATGQKMSKSKGNVVDPLLMIDKYGTDAFRFTLTAFAAQGRDIKFSEERVDGYRHFVNKIWNAARFILMNTGDIDIRHPGEERQYLSLADRWILSRLGHVISEVNTTLKQYRFNDGAAAIYQFIWHEFCDWYIEMAKPAIYGGDKNSRTASVSTLIHTIETSMRLLHPFMPFVTEELWQHIPHRHIKRPQDSSGTPHKAESITIAAYPTGEDGIEDLDAEEQMGKVMKTIDGIRSVRGELNILPSLEIKAIIKTPEETGKILKRNIVYIEKLAKAKEIVIGNDIIKPRNSVTAVEPGMEIFIPLEGVFDPQVEIKRIEKEIKKMDVEITRLRGKLSNEEFLGKAPKDVVEKEKERYRESIEKVERLMAIMEKLKMMGEET